MRKEIVIHITTAALAAAPRSLAVKAAATFLNLYA
jgi:hypothetical protein